MEAHFGHGDGYTFQVRVAQLAALDNAGDGVAHLFADAQLSLAWRFGHLFLWIKFERRYRCWGVCGRRYNVGAIS